MESEWQITVYGRFSDCWEEDSLSQLCSSNSGVQTGPFGSQLHQRDYVEHGTPIITVEHLDNNRIRHANTPKVSAEDCERLKKYTLQYGDIVFSRVGSVDRRALVRTDEHGWLFSGRCLRVRPNASKIDSSYLSLFFGLEAFKQHVRAIAVGATMPSINTKILQDLRILFPPLAEQRRIATVLGALDDKIELNRKMNRTLEEMAQALFKSRFIDFDGHTDLVDSELGPIPRGWEVGTIGDLIKFQNGYAFKSKDSRKSGIPVVKIGSVQPQIVDLGKVSFVSESVAQIASHFQLSIGDILIGMTGYVGEVGRIPPTSNPPLLNQRVGRILFGENRQRYEFIYCLMRNSAFRTYVEKMAHGSAQANVSGKAICTYPSVIPPNSVLVAFNEKCNPLLRQILSNVGINNTLAQLRDTLLPKLISGEIRVPEAEQQLEAVL